MKIEQLSMLATVVVAFTALAALVLTGQAGIRQDLRALQTDMRAGQVELRKDMRAGQADMRSGQVELRKDMRAGQAELRKDMRALQAGLQALRAGQVDLREDLARLGVRLAVVEHRTDALDSRFAEAERRMVEWHAVADAPDAGADSAVSPAGPPPRAIPSR